MDFPEPVRQWLLALRDRMQVTPVAAVGPLLGVVAAHAAVAVRAGDLGSVALDVVLMPVLALVIVGTAHRPIPVVQVSLFVFGVVTVVGGAALAGLALRSQSAELTIAAARHVLVGVYSWAAAARGERRSPARRRLPQWSRI